MGQTDKQFGGFLRMLLMHMNELKAEIQKSGTPEALERVETIIRNLEDTLND